MNAEYIDFFLNSKSEVIQFELLEIEHPNFSKIFRIVRNNTKGLTVTLEGVLGDATFDYYPVAISKAAQQDDLDFGLSIEIGDTGEILPAELDLIQTSDSFNTKPVLRYRTYRSDDLTKPMYGPLTLNIEKITFNKTGATLEARAPFLSLTQTGMVYTIDKFTTLEGFVE